MKKILILFLVALMCLLTCGCASKTDDNILDFEGMKNICELATIECYYHNVAKFTEENREAFLWIKKDAHFWIEYTGVVKYGIDASELSIEVKGNNVTVYIPDAKLLSVGDILLENDSYIIDKDSAKITAEDERTALVKSQADFENKAANNKMLLDLAKENAKKLIEDYILNIGEAFGRDYVIEWKNVNIGEEQTGAYSVDISTNE